MSSISTHIDIDGAMVAPGLATDHGDEQDGHIAIYHDGGRVTIHSTDPEQLRALAHELDTAADRLDVMLVGQVTA